MTRSLYGATPADVTFGPTGALAPSVAVSIYDASTSGNQITDLTTVGGSPITQATSDEYGFLAFYGPDGSTATLWADGGVGSRVALFPLNTSNVSTALLSDLSDVAATAPTSGQALAWNGSAWEPATIEGGGSSTDRWIYYDGVEGAWPARPSGAGHFIWRSVGWPDAEDPSLAEDGSIDGDDWEPDPDAELP